MRRDKIISNLYRDSIALMELSTRISKSPNISRATAVMATSANIALLLEAELLDAEIAPQPNDLLVVVEGADEASIAAAIEDAESSLRESLTAPGVTGISSIVPTSLQMGLEDMPDASIALISTPGEYAASEAEKALRLGLNAMVFTSNVAIEDELALKRLSEKYGLLLMGPDCGTAVVNGIPLGFANALKRGPVGAVASAGTGLQQVTCLVDRAGIGISQAFGCGSRDLSDEIGGTSMLQGMEMLAKDASTEIIVLIAKHPATKTAQRVIEIAGNVTKPVVINFLGFDAAGLYAENIHFADTLDEAAQLAVTLVRKSGSVIDVGESAIVEALANESVGQLTARQKYVRGLFSGGTFCYEAQVLLARKIGRIWSNAPISPNNIIPDVWRSHEHTLLDLGDEVFTRGRLHPMIDQRLKLERFRREMQDPEAAVILFDVVLGYGAHPNPSAEIADAITAVRRDLTGGPVLVASICGTERDQQNLQQQELLLRNVGVLVQQSNATAARVAAAIVGRLPQLHGS